MRGAAPHLRVARSASDLDATQRFYCSGLGLDLLGRFVDHEGFDGIMVGRIGWPYHLEFTVERGVEAPGSPDREHLLVFYLESGTLWRSTIEQMRLKGYHPVSSHNPYWDTHGVTFEDPDGYRVVLQNTAWNPV